MLLPWAVHRQIGRELAHLLPLRQPVALCRRSSMLGAPGRSSCRPFGLAALRRGDSMICLGRLLWLAASAVGRRAGYTQRREAGAIDLPILFSLVFIYRPDKGLRCAGSADALCATLRAGSVQPGYFSPMQSRSESWVELCRLQRQA